MPKNLHVAALVAAFLLVTALPVSAWGAGNTVLAPKANQVGYLPDAKKGFTIVSAGAAATGAPFEVRTSADALVYSGQLEASAMDETAATGEVVLRGDFSPLVTPGTYVVLVGSEMSRPFVVGKGVYGRLFRDAARAFSILRSGVAIDDPITGVKHAASHTMDGALRDKPGVSRDLTGGWYNAGDFGKWVHMAAISSSYMMWLHELRGSVVDGVALQIPGTARGVPDLLTEARWGLSWMLKMQNADGSVYHKVDTEPNFAWGKAPEFDTYARSAAYPSSIDAGDFVATMLQASRVFATIDPAFAATCKAAADLSWTWLQSNPNVPQPDPYYTDADASQEVLWALAERVRATHDAALTATLLQKIGAGGLAPVAWPSPQLLGYLSVALDPAADAAVKSAATAAIKELGEALLAKSAANGYGVALAPTEYWWGSVENVLNRSAALLIAHALTNDSRYRDGALLQLDWVLGRNSLDFSFVTHYGQNSSVNPYHWTRLVYSIVMPGWAVGGPNPNAAGADPSLLALQQLGTPPAKCYLDLCATNGSWASNEGQTSENAALLFAAGMLTDGTTDTSVPDPTTPRPTLSGIPPAGGASNGGSAAAAGSPSTAGVGNGGVNAGSSGVNGRSAGGAVTNAAGNAPANTSPSNSSGCNCAIGALRSRVDWAPLLSSLAVLAAAVRRRRS